VTVTKFPQHACTHTYKKQQKPTSINNSSKTQQNIGLCKIFYLAVVYFRPVLPA